MQMHVMKTRIQTRNNNTSDKCSKIHNTLEHLIQLQNIHNNYEKQVESVDNMENLFKNVEDVEKPLKTFKNKSKPAK